MKKKPVTYEYTIKDRESGKVIAAYTANFELTAKEEKSPMFLASLVYKEEELLQRALETGWSKVEPKKTKKVTKKIRKSK